MELIIDSHTRLEIVAAYYNGGDLHLTTEKHSELRVGSLIVLLMKNDTEILSMVETVDTDSVNMSMGIAINPNQKEDFKIKELAEALLWGQTKH